MTPNSPIRNYMKIISFDENKLKKRRDGIE
jgi:hypothetical protein